MDPHVTIDWLILQDECLALTNFEDFGGVLLLNVEIEELVLQILVRLAAVDDSIFRAIDLKQEEHVVLINLAIVVALNEIVDSDLHFSQFILFQARWQVVLVNSLLALNLGIDPLLFDQIALKQSIVELDLSQTLQIVEPCIAKLGQNSFEEVCHQVMMINEDLQEILNSDDLLRTQFKVLVRLSREMIAVSSVIDHGFNDSESYITHILHSDDAIVVFTPLNH